jgi:UDP-glucose 4-epimerase
VEEFGSFYRGHRVLLLGGAGLIGSTLAHRLVALGARVTIVDALFPQYGGNPKNLEGIEDRAALHVGDIRDEALMRGLVPGQQSIVNLAAQVSYTDSVFDPLLDLDINCRGHLMLLELCRHLNPDAKVLFAGSRLQFGRIERIPVAEDHPQLPLMPYGIHKMTAEKYCQMYHRIHRLRTTVLRLANPYGPRQQMKHSKYGIVNWFIRLAMEGGAIKVFGDGRQVRDYVYVDDVATAFLLAGSLAAADGEVFNVGSGIPTSFRQMAEEVVRVVGRGRIEFVPWPADYTNIETGDYVTDITRIKRLLGWTPRVSLADGIAETHRYYQRHRAAYWP